LIKSTRFGVVGTFVVSLTAFVLGLPADGLAHLHAIPVSHPRDVAPSRPLTRPADSAPPRRMPPAPANLRRLVSLHIAGRARPGLQTACLAQAVYHEAANQGLRGQLAVAQVILNRTRAAPFPRNACAVINQHGQFQGARAYRPQTVDTPPWRTAVAIATVAQQGEVTEVAPGALYFHAASVHPDWSDSRERIAQIGDHIFYR